MRYYSIKISQGASQSSPGGTSGATGSSSGGSSSSSTNIFTRSSGREIVSPRDISATLPTFTITGANPQPWEPTMNPDITGYNVDFSIPNVPSTVQPVSGASVSGAQWTSVVNGVNDPGALDIEFEINVLPNGQTIDGWLKIWGVTPQQISQSSKFTNCRIQLYGGFIEGLPLATLQVPHQGLLMDGTIFPAWGNWIMNELSLEFKIKPGPDGGSSLGGPTKPVNLVHNMPANQSLSTAIQTTLSSAFPSAQIVLNISDKLKLPYPDYGFYQSLEQYGAYIRALSQSILGTRNKTGYNGISFLTQGNKIIAYDKSNSSSSNAIPISYYDLVGQPTWIKLDTIQVKTLLRADIVPVDSNGNGTFITLPQNVLTTTTDQSALASTDTNQGSFGGQNVLNFQGNFEVIGVRHLGHFRQPTGEAWVTIITAQTPWSGVNSSPGGAANTSGQQTFNAPSGAASGASGGIGMA